MFTYLLSDSCPSKLKRLKRSKHLFFSRLKWTLFITTKHNMQILGVPSYETTLAQQLNGEKWDVGHLSALDSAVWLCWFGVHFKNKMKKNHRLELPDLKRKCPQVANFGDEALVDRVVRLWPCWISSGKATRVSWGGSVRYTKRRTKLKCSETGGENLKQSWLPALWNKIF